MLFLLTLLHFAVDGFCAAQLAEHALIFGNDAALLELFALYNLIAFGGQWLAGLVFDFHPRFLPKALLLASCFLFVAAMPFLALGHAVFLGLGNAFFHAAAGSLVLRRYASYAAPGIFVASGALGLALGLSRFLPSLFFGAIILCGTLFAFLLLCTSLPAKGDSLCSHQKRGHPALFFCVFLLLLCVLFRGFSPAHETKECVLLFPCAVAFGKALGGILCDRIGYRKTLLVFFIVAFLALQIEGLLSSLLLAFAFSLTMALTLRLANLCFPLYSGCVFGLTAACLLPGAFWGTMTLAPQAMVALVFLAMTFAGSLFRKYAQDRKTVFEK
ncbi:MAG: hypothetical protein J5803_01570 [Desulfovibrio sp.]|nr:hypothetical protein [Desulfovibrio sp.]